MQEVFWDHPRFRTWIAVARACHLVKQTLARDLKPLDLEPSHVDVLANVYRREGMSQRDLADRLLVGRSSVSMLLPQLEKRGLLERRACADDRRVLRLYLTEKGKEATVQAMEIQNALVARIMTLSSEDQCTQVRDTMRGIVGLLAEEQDDKISAA